MTRDELIVDRYYWVQFYEDNKWSLGIWRELNGVGYFDTALFYQDWYHPEAIRWILIPSPEELLVKTNDVVSD